MKRETRVALLVGMVFIALFGLVLGRRSLKIASATRGEGAEQLAELPLDPGPELDTARLYEADDRPVLAAPPPPPERTRRRQPVREVVRRTEPPVAPPPIVLTPPPAEPQPARPTPRRIYKVRAGDNLTRIAQKVYGPPHGREYRRIFQANRDKLTSPASLSVGQELVIPDLPGATLAAAPPQRTHYTEMTLEALADRFESQRTYVVRRGDTLTSIARRQMGSGSRATVKKLYQANRARIKDPNRLSVGLRLRIPR